MAAAKEALIVTGNSRSGGSQRHKDHPLKKQAGIWIDHRSALIVFIGKGAEAEERIESGVEKHARFSGRYNVEENSADDQQERQFTEHINRYYDEVIAHVCDAESILLMGPGEAKGELEKRLTHKGLGGQIEGIETTDKLTDNQIVATVRQHYKDKLANSR